MGKPFETDEDRMIEILELHRDTVAYIHAVLTANGVECEITRHNSPKGDILLVHQKDVEKAKSVLAKIDIGEKDGTKK